MKPTTTTTTTATATLAAAATAALSAFSLQPSAFGAASAASSAPAPRPNIMIILADDMGFSDLGCYGGEIHTPTLDKLASEGLRFTQFYNGARCCPTRAAILSGLYAHQAGMGHMTQNKGLPGYTGALAPNCMTIAEVLRPAGYDTYAIGKWHVSLGVKDTKNHPLQRGFNHYYGIIGGAANYYNPDTLTRDNTPITAKTDPAYKPAPGKPFYFTDAIADNTIMFLKDHQRTAADKPFFMYVAFTAAHWPMMALPEDIDKYKGVYDKGYDPIRAARYKRTLELGTVVLPTKLSPPDNKGWAGVPDKKWEARCMEVYAAMIDRMEQGIARIVAQLQASGQLDNTIILFLQDNGACAELTGRKPNGKKGYRTGPGVMPGPADTYIAYGHDWANVSNTPFREYKHWVHEGGISTPLIVHWPAGIPAALDNTFVRTPAHIIDLAATCVDLAGATYPAKREGVALSPLAGISLRPTFTGAPLQRPTPIFWEHEGNRAVRDGNWKLVAKGATAPWELYDMSVDRSELNNLASKNKDVAARLAAAWQQWATANKVIPWPWAGPNGSGKKAAKGKKNREPAEDEEGG